MNRRTVLIAALALLFPLLVFAGSSSATSATVTGKAGSTSPALTVKQVVNRSARVSTFALAGLKRKTPGNTTAQYGPSFNNPTNPAKRRVNLARIYRYVESSAGYKVRRVSQCPKRKANWPSQIRVAVYSFSDARVADALIRAHRRCVSVRVLMNNHLSNRDVPAFGRMQGAMGTKRGARSFARRCNGGCRGGYVLHSKIFLFSKVRKAKQVVTFGSSNMTGKAAGVQWNDLFVIKDRPKTWVYFNKIFSEMVKDRRPPKPIARNYRDGRYLEMFWPQPGNTVKTDRVQKALRKVRCNVRPTGGTGFNGRTAVSIEIHAMSGKRGLAIADRMVRMKRAGCRMRILYGLIAPRIHRLFKANGVPNRRTIFDRDNNGYTDMYTHMKYVGVNGAVDGDRGIRRIYTGSENFSPDSLGADEVWVQMNGATGAWRKYQKQFDMIWNSNYYSSPKYAWYDQSTSPDNARTAPGAEGELPPGTETFRITPEDLEL